MNQTLLKLGNFKCDLAAHHGNLPATYLCLEKSCKRSIESKEHRQKQPQQANSIQNGSSSIFLCSQCVESQHSTHCTMLVEQFLRQAKVESNQSEYDLSRTQSFQEQFEVRKENALTSLAKISQLISECAQVIEGKQLNSTKLGHGQLMLSNLQHQEELIQRAFGSNMTQKDYEGLLKNIAEGVTKHRQTVQSMQQTKKADEEDLKEMELIQTKLSKEAVQIFHFFQNEMTLHAVERNIHGHSGEKMVHATKGSSQHSSGQFEKNSKILGYCAKDAFFYQKETEGNQQQPMYKHTKMRLLEIQNLNPHSYNGLALTPSKSAKTQNSASKLDLINMGQHVTSDSKLGNSATAAASTVGRSQTNSIIKGYSLLSGKKEAESCSQEVESESSIQMLKSPEAIFASIFPSSASKIQKMISPTQDKNGQSVLGQNVVFITGCRSDTSAPFSCLSSAQKKTGQGSSNKEEMDQSSCAKDLSRNNEEQSASKYSMKPSDEDQDSELISEDEGVNKENDETSASRRSAVQSLLRLNQQAPVVSSWFGDSALIAQRRKERKLRKREQKKLKRLRMQQEFLIEQRQQQAKLKQLEMEQKQQEQMLLQQQQQQQQQQMQMQQQQLSEKAQPQRSQQQQQQQQYGQQQQQQQQPQLSKPQQQQFQKQIVQNEPDGGGRTFRYSSSLEQAQKCTSLSNNSTQGKPKLTQSALKSQKIAANNQISEPIKEKSFQQILQVFQTAAQMPQQQRAAALRNMFEGSFEGDVSPSLTQMQNEDMERGRKKFKPNSSSERQTEFSATKGMTQSQIMSVQRQSSIQSCQLFKEPSEQSILRKLHMDAQSEPEIPYQGCNTSAATSAQQSMMNSGIRNPQARFGQNKQQNNQLNSSSNAERDYFVQARPNTLVRSTMNQSKASQSQRDTFSVPQLPSSRGWEEDGGNNYEKKELSQKQSSCDYSNPFQIHQSSSSKPPQQMKGNGIQKQGDQVQEQLDFTKQLRDQLEKKVREEQHSHLLYSQASNTRRLPFQLVGQLKGQSMEKYEERFVENEGVSSPEAEADNWKGGRFDDLSPILHSPNAHFSPIEQEEAPLVR